MFIEKAYKAKHDFWRYLIGSVVIIVASLIGQIPLGIALLFLGDTPMQEKIGMDQQQLLASIDSNLSLFLMLFSFAVALVGVWLSVRYIHLQRMKDITTTRKKVDWGRVFFGFSLIAVFSIVVTAIDYKMNPEDYVWNFRLVPFLLLALISIVMIPIQTSLEEYVFRGYLMQGFGMLAKNRWFPLLMTSLIFGGLHALNPEVSKIGPVVMVFYIGTGLLLGIMTLMDEGMELSLGFHAGNNLITALLVTADWTVFQTNSVLKDVSQPEAGLDVVLPVVIVYPLFLLIIAKRYKWKNWKEKLFGNIDPTSPKLEQNEL